jgi:phenylacetate-CoA ligase
MNSLVQRIYWRLPASWRDFAAGVHGARLSRARYGPDTDRLMAEVLEREHWSEERWKTWRQARLAALLERAATRVPFYREQWAVRRRAGDRSDPGALESWPLLEKDDLRRQPRSFLADDCRTDRMVSLQTSGTSGKPLKLWRSRDTNRAWYALFEVRSRLWHGVDRACRWANLGGQLVTAAGSRRPPFWVWNRGLNQLYMSSYHLAPDLLPYYLEALQRYRIEYLYGYSSSLHALALGVLGSRDPQAARDLNLRVALSNAEPLFEGQRRAIEQAFGCPVRETYGMAEIAAGAGECAEGSLHEWPEAGLIELLEGGQEVPGGQAGEVVATCLLNADMPLIRYRVGDRAVRAPQGPDCRCGRSLPRLERIEGRVDDVLLTADGRRIGRLDPVFKADLPMKEAQIVQETLQRVVLKYVPDSGFSRRHQDLIRQRLQERLGPIEVAFEEVTSVPRGANGKFRAVVCLLPPDQRPPR